MCSSSGQNTNKCQHGQHSQHKQRISGSGWYPSPNANADAHLSPLTSHRQHSYIAQARQSQPGCIPSPPSSIPCSAAGPSPCLLMLSVGDVTNLAPTMHWVRSPSPTPSAQPFSWGCPPGTDKERKVPFSLGSPVLTLLVSAAGAVPLARVPKG